MKSTSILIALILALAVCFARPATAPAASTHISSGITAKKALNIVSALPEAKAWAKYISDNTGGEVHATCMVMPEHPVKRDGKQYWSVNCYEGHPSHLQRWQTFMIRLDGKKIMVDDITGGEEMTLKQWRDKENPTGHIREAIAP